MTENCDSTGRKEEIYFRKQEVQGKVAPGIVYLVGQQCHQGCRLPALPSLALQACSQGCFPHDCRRAAPFQRPRQTGKHRGRRRSLVGRKTFPEALWQITLTSPWPELSLAGGHYNWLGFISTDCLVLGRAKSSSSIWPFRERKITGKTPTQTWGFIKKEEGATRIVFYIPRAESL